MTRTAGTIPIRRGAGDDRLKIVFIGLSITSSWGNGHATTYRGLVRELVRRGHEVLFLEHDKPWYASNRDMPRPSEETTCLYESVADLQSRFEGEVRDADLVIVGSYVPEGIAVGQWVTSVASGVTAFYDIDTPVTLAALERGDCAVSGAARRLLSEFHRWADAPADRARARVAAGAPVVLQR